MNGTYTHTHPLCVFPSARRKDKLFIENEILILNSIRQDLNFLQINPLCTRGAGHLRKTNFKKIIIIIIIIIIIGAWDGVVVKALRY